MLVYSRCLAGAAAVALAAAPPGLAQAPTGRPLPGAGPLAGSPPTVAALGSNFDLVQVSNGFGQALPHRVLQLVGGAPSQQVVEIRSIADLLDNVTPGNPLLPSASFPPGMALPDGTGGNHYLVVEFSDALDIDTILSPSAQPASQLTGALRFEAIDPSTGSVTPVGAAAFVNGAGYLTPDPQNPGQLLLQPHVGYDAVAGVPVSLTPQGFGFPFTQGGSTPGLDVLVSDRALVLVADTDGDLTTHETFPAGVQLALRFGDGVRSAAGASFQGPALASLTVGPDQLGPEVAYQTVGAAVAPSVQPPSGSTGVDPTTDVTIEFTEALQPASVGPFPGSLGTGIVSSVSITFGPPTAMGQVPFTALPVGPYDLGTWVLDLAYDLPGKGSSGSPLALDFAKVDVLVNALQLADLTQNVNQLPVASNFEVGEGVGIVNAPVAPDAVYAVRQGSGTSLSVIDLNGFGAGTGNPTYDVLNPIQKGNSNYPNNPNLSLQGALLEPALQPGSFTHDGGSAGVFTLTLDSNLDDRLLRGPQVQSIVDVALGHPLDLVFNNGPAPFGCQAGSPNLCASTGLKQANPVLSGGSIVPALPGQFPTLPPGLGNLISWAPHPNPPPLIFPPACVAPLIAGQEPTSTESFVFSNLLAPGTNPLGDPALGVPPTTLLADAQNAFFVGPSKATTSVVGCAPFQYRQQVGHFLYLLDGSADEVVVVNSNRMTVLDRIAVEAPSNLAIGPNLNLMAVTSRTTGRLSFVDIDPASSNFHQVVSESDLGPGLADVVWQPDDEDILVVNEEQGELIVVSAFDLQPRKVIATAKAAVRRPFAIAATNRQTNFGLGRGVYFAFVLGRNGRLGVFESGPTGSTGLGSDDLLAAGRLLLPDAKDLVIDPASLEGAVWVAHEWPLDPGTGQPKGQAGGALTRLALSSAVLGPLQTGATPAATLADRQLELVVTDSVGEDVLTGVPLSLAFDEQVNLGALKAPASQFAGSQPILANSKSLVREFVIGAIATREPQFLFAAVQGSSQGGDVVDVLDLSGSLGRFDTDPFQDGTQSISLPGVSQLIDWFGQ